MFFFQVFVNRDWRPKKNITVSVFKRLFFPLKESSSEEKIKRMEMTREIINIVYFSQKKGKKRRVDLERL